MEERDVRPFITCLNEAGPFEWCVGTMKLNAARYFTPSDAFGNKSGNQAQAMSLASIMDLLKAD
jgi:hypothetical protein